MKAFIEKAFENQMFCGTVGPGDYVFVPAGFIFVERIGTADSVGLRLPLLSLKSLGTLRAIEAKLAKLGTLAAPLQVCRLLDHC